jgi:hypothetical protein
MHNFVSAEIEEFRARTRVRFAGPCQRFLDLLAVISIVLAKDQSTLDGVVTMKLLQALKYEISKEFAKA